MKKDESSFSFGHEYSGFTNESVRNPEDVEREIRNMSMSELLGGSIGDTLSKNTVCSDCGNTTNAGKKMHWGAVKDGHGYVCAQCWGNRGKQAML